MSEESPRYGKDSAVVTVTGLPMPTCPACGRELLAGGGFILQPACVSLVAECVCGEKIELRATTSGVPR